MNYLAGNDVTLPIELLDDDGNTILGNSVTYKVTDERGAVIVPITLLATFTANDISITLVITALQNTLPVTTDVTSLRGLRFIEIYISNDTGIVKKEFSYIIESDNLLVAGINSFQSYQLAIFNAGSIDKVNAFNAAHKSDKIIALIRSRQLIGRLSFKYGFDNFQYLSRNFHSREILLATQAQFEAYPVQFKEALARAQVIQANDLLDDNEVTQLRKDGLTSIQVGEAKQSFRFDAPLETVVSRRTMKELAKYINYTVRVSR